MHRLRLLLVPLVAVIVAVAATAAGAFFSASGTGATNARVADLTAPANVRATTTSGTATVHLTWDAATLPAATVDGYLVERHAGNVATPACGGALQTNTTCDDT